QGYFQAEPLLVVPRNPAKTDTGRDDFIVVEGNRRLAAVRLLLDPESAPARQRSVQQVVDEAGDVPESLPVIVFSERAATLDYLGFRHVTGVKAWAPLAKARYLSELYQARRKRRMSRQAALKDIALTIGSRSDYVAKLLTTLAVYDHVAD